MKTQAQRKREMLAKMLPKCYHQLSSKHCMCTISIFGVNDHGKVLSVGVLTHTIIYTAALALLLLETYTPPLYVSGWKTAAKSLKIMLI